MLLGLGGADGALHPARAARSCAPFHPATTRPRRRPLAGALPDRRAARRLRDHRRDPEQLRRVLDPGAHARRLEPRDHRSGSCSACRASDGTDGKLYVYAGVDPRRRRSIQVLLPLPWLRGRDGRLQMVIDWRDPAVAQVFKLMLPVTLGLGLININALIDGVVRLAAASTRTSRPAAIDEAFRIYMLPQGMFSVAVATVLFPSLARLRVARRHGRLPQHGLARAAPDRVPARAGERRLRGARRADRRGSSTSAARSRAARRRSSPARSPRSRSGSTFNGTMLMLNRAFFSLQSNWIPTVVALGNLFLNALLDVGVLPLGIWGIPLATSLVNIAGTAALLLLLRRRLGRHRVRRDRPPFGLRRARRRGARRRPSPSPVWCAARRRARPVAGRRSSCRSASRSRRRSIAYLVACSRAAGAEMQALLSLRSRFRRG